MKRSEVKRQYTWDLESIFATDEDWEKEFKDVSAHAGDVAAYAGKLGDRNLLKECYDKADAVSLRLEKLYSYAHMRADQNTADGKYIAMRDRCFQLIMGFQAAAAYISPELSAQSEEYLDSLISDPSFAAYDYQIKELKRSKRHVLSDKEEKLLAMAAVPLESFSEIFGQVDNVDVKLGSIRVNGKKEKLTHGRYSFFLQNKDQNVRRAAFRTYYKGYIDLINTITATYAGNVKKDNFIARARGFKSCMQMKMFNENVPEKVYDNLLKAVHKNFGTMHEYVALRKKVLGVDTLNMYDMYVPITSAELSVDFEEAFKMVKTGLKPLGEEYAGMLQRAYDERWMDVYETENKRSGAYSGGCFGTKPFVLLNYSATVHDIFTIAHELGHSMHTYFSNHTQPYAKANYEIFVAEVASTVNEVLLLKDMLAKAKDKELKKFLLSYYLDMFRTTLFRQTMFAEFEKIAHEMDDKGEALTPDALNKTYYKLNKKYYGKAVKHNKEIAYEWARIPHFYTSFYVYKYATGITSAISIAKNILTVPGYFDQYKKFLSAGGSDSPYEILKLTGVDLCTQKPFEDAMEEMSATLKELEAMSED